MNEYLGGWNIGLKTNPEPPDKPMPEHRDDAEMLECDACVTQFWTDKTDGWFEYDKLVLCPRCAASCIQH